MDLSKSPLAKHRGVQNHDQPCTTQLKVRKHHIGQNGAVSYLCLNDVMGIASHLACPNGTEVLKMEITYSSQRGRTNRPGDVIIGMAQLLGDGGGYASIHVRAYFHSDLLAEGTITRVIPQPQQH